MSPFLYFVSVPPESGRLYQGDYDAGLVLISILIAILAAYVALMVSRRLSGEPRAGIRRIWWAVGGIVMGAGVWSMHFIAMLAFHLPCATTYDPRITAASILPAMLASAYMVNLLARPKLGVTQLLFGGLIMGAGIGTMHYVGMTAYRIEGTLQYDLMLFCLSIVVAVVLATLALEVKFHLAIAMRGRWTDPNLLGGAVLMGLAISGMHYTAMEATYFVRGEELSTEALALSPEFMTGVILAVVGSLTVIALLALYLSQLDTHGLRLPWRFSLLTLVIWTSLSWMLAQEYSTRMTEITYAAEREVTVQLLARLGTDLSDRLHKLDNIAQLLAGLSEIQDFLSEQRDESKSTQQGGRLSQRDVNEWLAGATQGMSARFWLVNAHAVCEGGCRGVDASDSVAGQPYFEAALRGDMGHYYNSAGQNMVHAYPVIRGGHVLGAVLVNYRLAEFGKVLADTGAYLVDQSGQILVGSARSGSTCNGFDNQAMGKNETERRADSGQTHPISLSAYCQNPEWTDLYRIHGNDVPVIVQHQTLPGHGLTLYIRRAAPEIRRIAERQLGLFVMMALVGDMMILSLGLIALHLQTLRREKCAAQESQIRIAQALHELDRERDRLEKILEFVPMPLAYCEPDGTISHRSRTFIELFGYHADEIPDVDRWFELVYPDPSYRSEARQDWAARVAAARARGSVIEPMLYHITGRDGQIHECEIHGIVSASGGQLVTMLDLTQRLQIERRLQEKQARYRTLFENSHDAILLYSLRKHGFVDCNTQALALFGLNNKADLMNRPLSDLSSQLQADGRDSQPLFASRLRQALRGQRCHFEWLSRKADGTEFPVDVLLSRLDLDGATLIQATVRDIAEIKQAREKLEFLAHHDSLTGLPNRVLFAEHLEQGLMMARRNRRGVALLFIDLDQFKPVNDCHGHAVGDVLLRRVGERIQNGVRQSDMVGRIGGDEFMVLLNQVDNPMNAGHIAEKIRRSLASPFQVDNLSLLIGSSIGVALYPQHGRDAIELTRHADAAMYQAKQAGRNQVVFYRPDLISPETMRESSASQVERIEIFPWDDNFNTNLPEIDQQHHKLVEILNDLAMHVAFKPENTSELNAILDALVNYTQYHFRTEEAFWHRYLSGSEDEIRHLRGHQGFIEKVRRSRQAAERSHQYDAARELLAFLTRWLASHILEHDRQMALQVMAIEAGADLAEAKRQAEETLRGGDRQLTEIILAIYGTLTDNTLQLIREIADRQQAQQALRLANVAQQESLSRLQLLLESSQDGIIEMDNYGFVTGWNPQAERIFGYPKTYVMGRELAELIVPPAYREAHRKGVAKLKTTASSGLLGKRLEVVGLRADGTEFPLELTIAGLEWEGIPSYSAFVRDLTERKAAQSRIERLATHDSLTDLPNRHLLTERLLQALENSRRHRHGAILLLLDVDQFKAINDNLGHAAGDLLLQQIAQRLKEALSGVGMVARMGADEFAVLVEEPSMGVDHEALARQLLEATAKPYLLGDQESRFTACVGGVLFGNAGEEAETLLRRASIALYHAKADGRESCRFYTEGMEAIHVRGALLEADLRQALERGQFELYYQLQVDAQRRVVATEALLRWHHPERGIISPVEYIALAEQSGLIVPIGHWILDTACAQLARWRGSRRVTIGVNLSVRQFNAPNFVESLNETLQRHGVRPGELLLELTESLLLNASDETLLRMNALRDLGVSFAMDDFGTGYSSLAYLTQLPLNQLKIDQSFIYHIGQRRTDELIIKTIIGMASDMNLEVVAEGVETEAQFEFLNEAGCQLFQGYLFGRPMPVSEFEKTLDGIG